MRHHRGFTLIELLFALGILTLVVTTTLFVFITRTKRLRQANEVIVAYQILSNEAELQRRVKFTDITPSNLFTTETTLLRPLQPYTTRVDVTENQVGIKTVTMSIKWNNGQREAKLAINRVDTGGANLW